MSTLGDAWTHGWEISVFCEGGIEPGPRKHKHCDFKYDIDMLTMLITRGRAFPLCDLPNKMRCPRCGLLGLKMFYYVPGGRDEKKVAK